MDHPKIERGLIIPYEKLSSEALRGLIEEFVTRHGMDGGYTLATLDQNVTMVMGQLQRREVVVVFDEATNSANIVPRQYLNPSPDTE
jgi:uncharacterized protein YheU (UPF0270 family)